MGRGRAALPRGAGGHLCRVTPTLLHNGKREPILISVRGLMFEGQSRLESPSYYMITLTINSVFIYHTKSHPCLPSRISRQSLAYL